MSRYSRFWMNEISWTVDSTRFTDRNTLEPKTLWNRIWIFIHPHNLILFVIFSYLKGWKLRNFSWNYWSIRIWMRLQKYFNTIRARTIFQHLGSVGSKYLWRLEVQRCQLPKLGLSCRLKSLFPIFFSFNCNFFFLWYIALSFSCKILCHVGGAKIQRYENKEIHTRFLKVSKNRNDFMKTSFLPKYQRNSFRIFSLASKKRSSQESSVRESKWNPPLGGIKCLFLIWPHFRGQGRNP